MHTVVLRPLFHRGQEVVAAVFSPLPVLESALRKLKGIKWTQTHKAWYLPLSKENVVRLAEAVKPYEATDLRVLRAYLAKRRHVAASNVQAESTVRPTATRPAAGKTAWQISRDNLSALNLFVEQLTLKAYSSSTVKTYRSEFLQLLQVLKKKPVNELTPADLRRYFLYCVERLELSENTLHSRINAVKFYFEQVLKREKFFWEIPRPKKEIQNPKFFNQDEVTAIIKAASNLKHRAMLMLAYSAGLRVSEVVSIKSRQVDSQRMCIFIEQAKGKKDRIVALSPVLLVMLREYWKAYRPSKLGYLFAGQTKDEPYSTRSLQLVLAAAKQRAGVIKPGSMHALRHSFATHLLDKGTDVTMIMKLLGHNDIKTTLRYLHVTNRDVLQVLSPLDDLKLD